MNARRDVGDAHAKIGTAGATPNRRAITEAGCEHSPSGELVVNQVWVCHRDDAHPRELYD